MKGKYFCIFISVAFLLSCKTLPKKTVQEQKNVNADSISLKYQLVSYVPGIPVELNIAPNKDGKIFVTDNIGKIWILNDSSLESKPFFNIYDKIGKQTKNSLIGLIYSVAFSPQYATNHKFYVYYNAPSKIRKNIPQLVVSEFTADKNNPDIADLKSERRIIEFDGSKAPDNGAQIAFGPDGYLYISIGDENAGDTTYHYNAQDLRYLDGKLLRIDVSKSPYAIPPDNPFAGVKNARPEIWAYGFRKLWRFSFDPVTHQIFGGDVGEDKEEEIDIVTKGSDYGWPVKEGDSSFKKSNSSSETVFTPPAFAYTHEAGICVVGGNFYYGNKIPLLKNKYVFADWKTGMFALSRDKDNVCESQPLKIMNMPSEPFFICGCCVDNDSQIFVLGYFTDQAGERGVIYKIEKG